MKMGNIIFKIFAVTLLIFCEVCLFFITITPSTASGHALISLNNGIQILPGGVTVVGLVVLMLNISVMFFVLSVAVYIIAQKA